MDKKSVLMGGVEQLEQIKEKLIQQSELQKSITEDSMTAERLEKETTAEENYVVNTIETTIKERRSTLADGFDRQIDDNTRKLKSVESKREVARKKAVANRIASETADIRQENKELHSKIRKEFNEKKVPKFCDSTFYYALFQASDKRDFIIFALTTVILLAIIPNIICFLVPWFWAIKVALYVGIVAVIIFIYCVIYKYTKAGKSEAFKNMKPDRDLIYQNKKRINATKKFIKKDNDDSTYGLEGYDEQIESFNDVIGSLRSEQVAALKEFDNVTVKVIKADIINSSKEKIADLKNQRNALVKEIKSLESKLKTVSTYIATNYEAYMGRKFMNVDEIERMIALIEDEKASVIAEAMGIVKGES